MTPQEIEALRYAEIGNDDEYGNLCHDFTDWFVERYVIWHIEMIDIRQSADEYIKEYGNELFKELFGR